MINIENETNETYEKKYKNGYGLVYPEGHVVRFHRHILEYDKLITNGKILDYGCGSGAHLHYFQQHDFIPYGCDISAEAIEKCKTMLPAYASNFHVVPCFPKIRDFFSENFDLVFSNQVLYYLNNQHLRTLLLQLYEVLKPGGIFFATMMASSNYYARFIEGSENGLQKVVLKGRLNETHYINFMTKEQVLDFFTSLGFKKLHLGMFSGTIREDEGPTDHHIFVGTKPF